MHKRALSKYIKSPNLNSPTSEREAVSFYFANFYPTKVVGRGPRTTTRNFAMLCISQFHLRPNPPPPLCRATGYCPPCRFRGWGISRFSTALGPGFRQPPGHSPAFDTRAVSYQNITTLEVLLERKAVWLICQGQE